MQREGDEPRAQVQSVPRKRTSDAEPHAARGVGGGWDGEPGGARTFPQWQKPRRQGGLRGPELERMRHERRTAWHESSADL